MFGNDRLPYIKWNKYYFLAPILFRVIFGNVYHLLFLLGFGKLGLLGLLYHVIDHMIGSFSKTTL